MPVGDASQGVQIEVAQLKEMVQQVAFAASSDEARPVLTGVLIQVHDSKITLAAADGFRLSVRKADLGASTGKPFTAIVPARALTELARIASDSDGTVTMLMPPGRGQVVFRLRNAELVSQLIEGSFPDYEQIIPRRVETRTVLSTAQFLKACKQAEIFAREGSHIARLNIKPGGELKPGTIEVSGQSEETGSSQNEIEASIEGTPLVIAFNVRFLREILDVVKSPNVSLETTAQTSPGLLRPVGESDFLHVIMPMHLGN
jgi:DNA polymerase-3 subunit beta